MTKFKFKVGDKALKPTGYVFEGEIRSVFTNKKGEIRVVVELVSEGNGNGLMHIMNEQQLEKA